MQGYALPVSITAVIGEMLLCGVVHATFALSQLAANGSDRDLHGRGDATAGQWLLL